MFAWLKSLFAPSPHIEFHATMSRSAAKEPHPDEGSSSSERIKRVQVAPLPFRSGEEVFSGSKASKRFTISVTQQKPGVFEMDEVNSIIVYVVARGRLAAMSVLSEKICGRDALSKDDKDMLGGCGSYYDGTRTDFKILAVESC